MALEFQKFRVRTPIRTFRDLDVYKNTTLLCVEIFKLKLPEKYRKKEKFQEELILLGNLAKKVPLFIAERHSRKFGNLAAGQAKLEQTAEIINMLIAKIDFLSALVEDDEFKATLLEWIKKYQINKRKILNLKRAWERVFIDYRSKFTQNPSWKKRLAPKNKQKSSAG